MTAVPSCCEKLDAPSCVRLLPIPAHVFQVYCTRVVSNIIGGFHASQQTTVDSTDEARIAVCFSCAQMCNTCSDDMIGMEHHKGDMELMERCIRLCRECADICVLAGQWMNRVSAVRAIVPVLRRSLRSLCRGVRTACTPSCFVPAMRAGMPALCGELSPYECGGQSSLTRLRMIF